MSHNPLLPKEVLYLPTWHGLDLYFSIENKNYTGGGNFTREPFSGEIISSQK